MTAPLAVLTPPVVRGQGRASGAREAESSSASDTGGMATEKLLSMAPKSASAPAGIVTDTGDQGCHYAAAGGRGAEARGQRTPTARRAAGRGTLGFLQQIVVDGVHPALHSVVIHSIPSFSSTVRRR